MAGTNSFWYRGIPSPPPETVIVAARPRRGQRAFTSCSVAAKNTNRYNVVNEESRDPPDILVCAICGKAGPEFWRNFDALDETLDEQEKSGTHSELAA